MIMVEISLSLVQALLPTVIVDICHQKAGNLFWLILQSRPDGDRLAPEARRQNLTLVDTVPERFVFRVFSVVHEAQVLGSKVLGNKFMNKTEDTIVANGDQAGVQRDSE